MEERLLALETINRVLAKEINSLELKLKCKENTIEALESEIRELREKIYKEKGIC